MFVAAGYFRARLPALSSFDKVLGGLAWAIAGASLFVFLFGFAAFPSPFLLTLEKVLRSMWMWMFTLTTMPRSERRTRAPNLFAEL
jgi:tellurite resistance protein TehA-like permease